VRPKLLRDFVNRQAGSNNPTIIKKNRLPLRVREPVFL
jgi:hypothetical protein